MKIINLWAQLYQQPKYTCFHQFGENWLSSFCVILLKTNKHTLNVLLHQQVNVTGTCFPRILLEPNLSGVVAA